MKHITKLTVIFALVFLSSQVIYAQNWNYGVKVDLNYSTARGKGMADKLSLGYSGGGWVNYALNKKFKVQAELTGVQYNYTRADDFDKYYKNDVGRADADPKIRLAYLNVPVLFRYDIIPRVSVLAGPQIGVAFFKDENLRKDGVTAFKNTETSVVGGVQVNLGTLGIYGRYTQGLSDISNMGNMYTWNSQHIDFGIALRIR